MQKKVNTPNQIIQQQCSVGNLPQQVIQFFQCRIQTEQNYAKALQKLNNKFPNIQSHSSQSSKVLKHLKAIHSQKCHQTLQFLADLRQDKNNFQLVIGKSNQQLQKSQNQVKTQQISLKNIMQKISRLHIKGQQQINNIDQKFILKQIALLGTEYKTKKIQDSLKLLDQQIKICTNLKIQYQELKTQGQKVIKKIKKHEKIILQNSPLIQRQIIELVKKYTVQQVSLIRNLQYDIDNMIKKTNIFDEVPPVLQSQKIKLPKNPVIKSAKDIFKTQFKIKNIFQQTKKTIANMNQLSLKNMQKKQYSQQKTKQLQQLIKKWNQTKSVDNLIQKISQSYQNFKQLAHQFIQHFRNKNINKFSQKQFKQLSKLFNVLLIKNLQQKNFPSLQKLIIYGSCYYCQSQTNDKTINNSTIMDFVNKKQFLSDAHFWKFLLYFVVQRSVIQCLNIQNEKNMHVRNNVFSALVSNSLNMICSGIDKYIAKNTVAKIAKSFGLSDSQVGDLLKFVETGYQKYQKQKKNK